MKKQTPALCSSKRSQRALYSAAIMAAICLAYPALASGPIGFNFTTGASDTLGASEQAGAPNYVQANWNNGGASGTGVAAVDSTGNATGVNVSWHANDAWGNGTSTATPDGKLMHGYLDSTSDPNNDSSPYQFSANANSPDVYVQGLSPWMTTQGAVACDVVVYFNGDTAGRIGEYWIQQAAGTDASGLPNALGPDLTSHVFANADANFSNGTYVQVPLTAVDNSTAVVGNYIVFPGVTGDSFIIRTAEHSFRALINGFQIVPRSTFEPPTIVLAPQNQTKYAGGTATFTVGASGSNLKYQWLKSGASIANATNSSLTVSNLTTANNGTQYSVAVSNSGNSATSDPATLTVTAAPAASSFAGTVLADKALDYWRFNDLSSVVVDYIGSRNGTAGPTTGSDYGTLGLSPDNSFLGFESGNSAWQFIGLSDSSVCVQGGLGVITNAMTFVTWVYPNSPSGQQANWTGLLLTAGGNNGSGITYTDNKNELGYQWDNYYQFHSGLVVPEQQWSMVAMVVTPNDVTLYLANPTSGLLSAIDTRSNAPCVFNNDFWIGTDPTFAASRGFYGAIDELAVFKQSLTKEQILGLYSAGRIAGTLPPTISQQPFSEKVYAGGTVKLKVVAAASGPLTYQWKKAGSSLVDAGNISGSQSATLVISNVSSVDAATYSVDVKSAAGTTPSDTVTVSLVSPTGAAYEAAVLAAQPYAYWRFNEIGDTNAYDFVGGFTGTYGVSAGLGAAGPVSPDFPGFESVNNALQPYQSVPNSYMTVRGLNLNTNAMTFVGWIFSNGGNDPATGFIFCREGDTQSGLCYRDSTLSYTWAGNWDWHSSLNIPDSQWVFVALVVSPNQGTVFMGTNGVLLQSIRTMSHASQSFSGLTSIGADNLGANRVFNGLIDEVSIFNRSLSNEEIAQLYKQAIGTPVAPTITMLTSTNVGGWPGVSATFAVSAVGSGPLSYQWYNGATALVDGANVSGATTASLTITNATAANAGDYTLVVTGAAGQVTSDVCTLQVGVPPARPYDAVVRAANPVSYWRLNETSGTVAYDSVGTNNATYGTAVQLGATGQPGQGLFGFGTDTTAAQFTRATAQSWVTVPPLNLNSDTVTIMAWVYPTLRPDNWSGIFISQGASRAGLTFRDNTPDNTLGFMWNNGSFWYSGTSLNIPVGQWSLVSLSVDPASATLNVINSSGTQTWADNTDTMNPEPFSGTTLIGCDNGDTGRIFNGLINNVAVFNRTLSNDEVQGFYSAGATPQLSGVITLKIQNNANGLQLTWPRGVLYEADEVGGAWTAVPSAVSPYNITPTGTNKFYRVVSDQ